MPEPITAPVRTPPTYPAWTAAMRALGAQISALPNDPKPLVVDGKPFPRVAAVFRDPQVWGPKVNAGVLPPADTYSKDGKTAYFLAPPAIQDAARGVYATRADDPVVVNAGKQLEGKLWDTVFGGPRRLIASALGIPPWAATAALFAGGAFVLSRLVGGSSPRTNPRGRRARRRGRR